MRGIFLLSAPITGVMAAPITAEGVQDALGREGHFLPIHLAGGGQALPPAPFGPALR